LSDPYRRAAQAVRPAKSRRVKGLPARAATLSLKQLAAETDGLLKSGLRDSQEREAPKSGQHCLVWSTTDGR
jgi:hypothetical protein